MCHKRYCQWLRGIASRNLILDKYFCHIHSAFKNNIATDDSVTAHKSELSVDVGRLFCQLTLLSFLWEAVFFTSCDAWQYVFSTSWTAALLAREWKILCKCLVKIHVAVQVCFTMKPLLAQQERLSKFDSHTGIMQIIKVSFQYCHICKYMPSSRFQALNVINKQESLTNKDQHPSFNLAWLNLLEDPHHYY